MTAKLTLPLDYWVEIIGQNDSEKTKDVKETDTGSYRFVHYHCSESILTRMTN